MRRGVVLPYRLAIERAQTTILIAKDKIDLLQGTLDRLILKSFSSSLFLDSEPPFVYGRCLTRFFRSNKVLFILHCTTLKSRAGLRRSGVPLKDNHKAKLYGLTRARRRQLEHEQANWACLSSAINFVLDNARGRLARVGGMAVDTFASRLTSESFEREGPKKCASTWI